MPWPVNHVALPTLIVAWRRIITRTRPATAVSHINPGKKQASNHERSEADVPTRTSACVQLTSETEAQLCRKHVCLYATTYVKPVLERTAQRVPSAFQTMQPAIQDTHTRPPLCVCVCLDLSNANNHRCNGLTPKNMETNEYNTIQYNTKGAPQASQMRGDPKRVKRILVTLGLGIWSNDALASFSLNQNISVVLFYEGEMCFWAGGLFRGARRGSRSVGYSMVSSAR